MPSLVHNFSTILLVPVLILLNVMLIWIVLQAGGLIHEWRERRRWKKSRHSVLIKLDTQALSHSDSDFFQRVDFPGLLAAFVLHSKTILRNPLALGKLMSDLEIESHRLLSGAQLGTRLGPMLGLMGTLIPMASALMGLSEGNIQILVKNLVIAFSTTVLGLFIGGVCYAISLLRRHWYAQDLADIDYIYNCICAKEGL